MSSHASIVSTLLAELLIRNHFRLGNVIFTVDVVNADLHLRNND
ncbi:MAG: hypothetical protein AAGA21_14440 [Pseudomonadota bacterium]